MINLQWGTQKNGQIDSSLLIDVSGRGDYLEPTAAVQWRRMVAACAAATGVTLRPASGSSAYRPVAIQQQFYANYLKYGSPVAAVSGTSNHGWARAVDITGYEGNTIWRSPRTGTKYAVNLTVWNWLQAHAGEYGYGWATGDASGEAWHWESLTPPGTTITAGGNAINLSAVKRPVRSTDMLFFEYNGTLPAGQRSVIAVDPATGTYRYPEPWEVGAIRNEVGAGRALINPLGEPQWSQTFSRLREVKIA